MHRVIVDGNSVAHWLFWGREQRKDSDGREVGMLSSLVEWIGEVERGLLGGVSDIVVCFDSPRNWRYELAPTYKGQRTERHPVLAEQLDRMVAYVEEHTSRRCSTWQREGFEADDLCAKYALDTRDGDTATVVSRDKDLRQLVDDARGVRAFDPVERVFYDEAAVLAKHGVPAYRLREWLALAGDAADNVKGAPGWGKDTAAQAIAASLDFEHLFDCARAGTLEGVTRRKQSALIDFETEVRLAYELVGFRVPG